MRLSGLAAANLTKSGAQIEIGSETTFEKVPVRRLFCFLATQPKPLTGIVGLVRISAAAIQSDSHLSEVTAGPPGDERI